MRIYVGTYKKYNEGNLFGEWLDLADYSDEEEFLEACHELHEDEEDPELMFQDWEGIPEGLVTECTVSPDCWEVLEAYDEHDAGAVNAYLSMFGGTWSSRDFEDRYHGQFSSWQDMAEELLDSTGQLEDIPENLRSYFDYEAYARDMRLGGEMCEEDGYFFWNH